MADEDKDNQYDTAPRNAWKRPIGSVVYSAEAQDFPALPSTQKQKTNHISTTTNQNTTAPSNTTTEPCIQKIEQGMANLEAKLDKLLEQQLAPNTATNAAPPTDLNQDMINNLLERAFEKFAAETATRNHAVDQRLTSTETRSI